MTKTSWRDHLKVHPAADLFPLLGADELRELADDIARHGVREKIKIIERSRRGDDGLFHAGAFEQVVIDGRNRLDALALAGESIFRCGKAGTKLEPDIIEVLDDLETDDQIAAYVISVNIKRRHLTADQKRSCSRRRRINPTGRSRRWWAPAIRISGKSERSWNLLATWKPLPRRSTPRAASSRSRRSAAIAMLMITSQTSARRRSLRPPPFRPPNLASDNSPFLQTYGE